MKTLIFLITGVTCALAQKPAFVVGEKAAGSIGFYDSNFKRVGGVKVGIHPHEIVLSKDKKSLYVADNGVLWMTETGPGDNKVSVIDIPSQKRTAVIDLGEYRRPHGITVDDASKRVLVSTEKPSWMLMIDAATNKIVRKYDVKGRAPHIVAMGLNDTAYVSNTDTGTVAVVKLGNGEVTLIDVGERPQGEAFSPDRKRLYVANSGGNTIAIVDLTTNKKVGAIQTGSAPVRVAVTPDGKTLIYAIQKGNAVGIADAATAKEIVQLPLTGSPVSMTLSLDGKLAYCSVQEQDKVFVISIADRKIVRVFEVPKGTGPDPVYPLE